MDIVAYLNMRLILPVCLKAATENYKILLLWSHSYKTILLK